VLLDGEEELNSPNLASAVERYRDKLRSDLLLVLDGPLHPSGKPTLVFGARGEVDLELTVYGPKFALHSGHYGNWAPNPAMRLAQLLGSMQDARGRVTVAGFYDAVKPLSENERQVLAAVPDDLPGLQKLFGIAQPDAVAATLQQALQYPSLNIDEFHSGSHNNVIPSEAYARMDLRLMPETTARAQADKVLSHIRAQGFHIIETEPDDAQRLQYPKLIRVNVGQATEAFRTPMDHPDAVRLTRALAEAWGEPPVRIRIMGGTVPLARVIATLGCPAILVPIVNFDNHQHSANENLRLGNLWRGIVTIAALL
jgi:acetylornithine deacetylase/succinyl-diaminopimelate desuccinylase-like protein